MAKNLGDLIVRLSLNSAAFDDGVKKFETQMTALQRQFQSAATGITDFEKVTAKLKTSADTLTQRFDIQKNKVSELEKRYRESAEATGEDSEETKKLATQLDAAKARMAETEKALALVNAEIGKNQNGWYQFGINLTGVGQKFEQVGKSMSSAGTKLTLGVTAPIVALGTKAMQAGIEFESAFAGVRKTVDASEAEFSVLSDSIRDMSKEIPKPAADLAGIMELAGQLGVRGTDNLTKFTKAIAALGVSTNLTEEDAASMLAQFSNITGMDIGNIDRLGSTIVALGNNFATTEADIVSMGMRLAGAGTTVGMTQAQIMGFATALSSVGIEAEAGGSAFSKLMVNMNVAADVGMKGNEVIKKTGMSLRELQLLADQDGKAFKALAAKLGMTSAELKNMMGATDDLGKFAKVAGMSGKEFARLFSEDAPGAIMKFLEGLQKVDQSGGSVITVLDDMGITEVRLRDAILRAASATDLFAAAQDLANGSWEENAALQKEASQRYATTESQLQLLKNAVTDLAMDFKDVMAPVLLDVVEKVRGVVDWFKNLSTEQKELVVKIAAVVAAVGPLLVIMGKLTSAMGSIMTFVGPIIAKFGAASAAAGTASASTGALGTALAALTGPIGIAIGAVAGLSAVFVAMYRSNEEFRDRVNAAWENIKTVFESVRATFQQTFQRMAESMEPVRAALSRLWESVQKVFMQIWNLIEPVVKAIGAALGTLATVAAGVANGIMRALGPLIEAVAKGVDVVINVFGALIALIRGDFSAAWNHLKSAFQSLVGVVKSVFTAIGQYITGFFEGVLSALRGFGVDITGFFTRLWNGIRSGVTSTWNAIKSTITGAVNGIRDGISGAFNAVKTNVSNIFSSIRSTTVNVWNGIRDAIMRPIETAKTFVGNMIERIRGFFNFSWSLPKLKLPHLKVTGSFSLNPPSVPRFGIEWYAKGAVLRAATLFGINPYTGAGMVGGEAGPEAIAPISTLMQYVRSAVRESGGGAEMKHIAALLDKYLPLLAQLKIYLDSGALVGELAPAMDGALSDMSGRRERGLA